MERNLDRSDEITTVGVNLPGRAVGGKPNSSNPNKYPRRCADQKDTHAVRIGEAFSNHMSLRVDERDQSSRYGRSGRGIHHRESQRLSSKRRCAYKCGHRGDSDTTGEAQHRSNEVDMRLSLPRAASSSCWRKPTLTTCYFIQIAMTAHASVMNSAGRRATPAYTSIARIERG